MTERLEATVVGTVQGVGFRWFVKRNAARLGLTGWVANDAGGVVRLVAEGESSALVELLELLRDGPPGASVRQVIHQCLPTTGGYERFEIRATGHSGD